VTRLLDPLAVGREFWPQYRLYKEQQEIVYSVRYNVETVVVAGNKLGKDFVAGQVCVTTAIAAIKANLSWRIVTTSVKEDHLSVLWGEIGRFMRESRHPLIYPDGPLIMNHMEIRDARERHTKNPYSYMKGMVAEGTMEALAGHHADITLAVMDEASGLSDLAYEKMQGWAKRLLIFGNPHQCQNFFRKMVKAGDLVAA
jgi:hypothetical protein